MKRREQEKERLKKYQCPDSDPYGTFGVLLSDEIERYVAWFRLIDPFDCNNLDPAAYKLTVGDECAVGGEKKELCDEPNKNKITIPPFEVAVIKTHETVNLPRFLIARWNIYITLAYEGLVWVGGPQVDPGYVGHLFCPVYNLSDKEVTLRLHDTIAIIDFIKTTSFKNEKYLFGWDSVHGNDNNRLLSFLKEDFNINWVDNAEITKTYDNKTIRIFNEEKMVEITLDEDKKKAMLKIGEARICDLLVKRENSKLNIYRSGGKEFSRPSKRVIFDDYPKLKSALYSLAAQRIIDIDEKVNRYEARVNTSLAILFTSISIIIATLSIFVTSKEQTQLSPPDWVYIGFAISIVALIFSIFAYTKAKVIPYKIPFFERVKGFFINIFELAVAIILALIIFRIIWMKIYG